MRPHRLDTLFSVAILVACNVCMAVGSLAAMDTEIDRTTLPVVFPEPPTYTELNARNTKPPAATSLKAPEDAPNVIVVLIDDLGFGATSTFGGPISTPTLDRLAKTGLRYNRFHTTALCSPTRAALKTGRNHHAVNMGSITESATAYPGNTGQIPPTAASVAEVLRLNGYNTGAFGKWHETAAWETSLSGPYDRWPTRQGFEKFYGFIGGETDQWHPAIFDGTTKIPAPTYEGYHFTDDMTDQAIGWIETLQGLSPDKPFFMYFATGAVHAPHHVPRENIDKYRGRFDGGWDSIRSTTLARQKTVGVVPEDTMLAPRPGDIQPWNELTDVQRKVFSRQAEVFAGFVDHTDANIGRLIDAVEDLGILNNTLIVFIAGDNGTSAEGTMAGLFNEMTYFNGYAESVEDLVPLLDEWGSDETYPHMAAGWAVAFDTPFTWTKQVASDFGGTRNGMVIHWPDGIKAKGELRTQFSHVVDIVPTILEAAKLPIPASVNGVPQQAMDGESLVYSFDNPDAEERHSTQYFEMFGNRAIYHEGWYARTIHKLPWGSTLATLEEDSWSLYNTENDFSLAVDLAAQEPERLAELQALFMNEAEQNHVLPIDDRLIERLNADLAGRPDLMAGRTTLTLPGTAPPLLENTFINVKNRSKEVIAEISVGSSDASGVIITQGGSFGGWSLYVRNGTPEYTYNYLGVERYTLTADRQLPSGESTIKLVFDYDGGGTGKGGDAQLFLNDELVATGRVERTQPIIFSADETADIGRDFQSPVAEGIGEGAMETAFSGRVERVTISTSETN